MRRQELFDLTWQDIHFENRRIHIKHDKNSWRRLQNELPEDRWIVLPPLSQMYLGQLAMSLIQDGLTPGLERFKIPKEFHPPHGKIFMGFEKTPMTKRKFHFAFLLISCGALKQCEKR
jgi:integrase